MCAVLVLGQIHGCALYSVSRTWEMVYLNLCPLPRKGPLTQGTWIYDLDVYASSKTYFLHCFPGRRYIRFWEVPAFGEWIWHHFSLWAKSWYLSPSSPVCCLTTWSQPAKCLWWWHSLRLCNFHASFTSPWLLRRWQRLLSASEESRFGDT